MTKPRDMQKFHRGDWVKIADDLGSTMRHFKAGCEAIVIGSYKDQYGGNDSESYTLHIRDSGKVSWYYGSQLTLIESARHDLLAEWERELNEKNKQESDLDWIFANGTQVLKSCSGSTVAALAQQLGVTNMWGAHGEGLAYHENARRVLYLAAPFLKTGDKAGFLEFAQGNKLATIDVCVYGPECADSGHPHARIP